MSTHGEPPRAAAEMCAALIMCLLDTTSSCQEDSDPSSGHSEAGGGTNQTHPGMHSIHGRGFLHELMMVQ